MSIKTQEDRKPLMKTRRPQITAYECMLLICSGLVREGKTILRQDTLVPTLYRIIKEKPETSILFKDVVFKNSLDAITSIDIENSLNKLQTFGAIGKLNPAYEKIVLYITPEKAGEFIDSFGEECRDAVDIVSKNF